VLRGRFAPAPGYAEVRRLFRADAVARALPADPDGEALLRAFYAARGRLAFGVADAGGAPVPVEYVHVYEPAAAGGELEVVARLAVVAPGRRHASRWHRPMPVT
jgi:hypothetical protein